MKASEGTWLTLNVAPILAILITTGTFALFVLAIYTSVSEEVAANENVLFMVIGGLISVLTAIVNYYWGSSAGSLAKNEWHVPTK